MAHGCRLLMSLGLGVAMVCGCLDDTEDEEQTNVVFRNSSSYTVIVAPDGNDRWRLFRLKPGQEGTVFKEDIVGDFSIRFSPFDNVYIEEKGRSLRIFRNR